MESQRSQGVTKDKSAQAGTTLILHFFFLLYFLFYIHLIVKACKLKLDPVILEKENQTPASLPVSAPSGMHCQGNENNLPYTGTSKLLLHQKKKVPAAIEPLRGK